MPIHCLERHLTNNFACKGKGAEALLKATFLNTTRFQVSPSNNSGSTVEKSNLLEYHFVHSCSMSDLRDELRSWSCMPALAPYQSVSSGGSDKRAGPRSLKTLHGQNVSLEDLLNGNHTPHAHAPNHAPHPPTPTLAGSGRGEGGERGGEGGGGGEVQRYQRKTRTQILGCGEKHKENNNNKLGLRRSLWLIASNLAIRWN